MIIRRRHTANFTTIGNALFNDDRLKPDEIGIIGYLLSRPHDWEVRRPQLAKRFGYGRDAIKRVMWNGMRHGWIVAQKTQLSDGRIFTIYEIRDEPGPELSDDDIRRALSLASSEAEESDVGGPDPDDHPDTGDPPTPNPATGQPGVVQPATGNPYVVSKEETTKYGFTKDLPTKTARVFADVLQAWPPAHVLSSVTAESTYAALSEQAKNDCFLGLKPYLDDCGKQNRKVCDLTTFIRERRWERFVNPSATPAPEPIKPYSPQWYRWREYRVATGQSITFMDDQAKMGRSWSVPSEWPPPMPAKHSADA